MNKIDLKFENKIYKIELPDMEGFTGQVVLTLHCKTGIPMEASISKKGFGLLNETYPQNGLIQDSG